MITYAIIKKLFVWMSVLLIFVASGCSKKDHDKDSTDNKDNSPIVASVGKSSITAAVLKEYLYQRPIPSSMQDSEETIKERLDEIVLQEVLYQEALRLGLDKDPQVQKKKFLFKIWSTQKLLNKQLNGDAKGREIEEDEITAYYNKHQDEFNRPAQMRLADIFISVPVEAAEAERDELKKKAETALAEALLIKGKRSGFGTLVSKYSDTNDKYRKGDTGYFDLEGEPVGIDKKLAQEAFKLNRIGDMPDHMIETSDGYHVIMLTGKRSAINNPLEKVRYQLCHE